MQPKLITTHTLSYQDGVVSLSVDDETVLLDAADVPIILPYQWGLSRVDRRTYAVCRQNGARYVMHRLLMRAPDGFDVDHVDGNGLNNTRTNLRLATRSQNMMNTRLSPLNTSGYRGVSWHRDARKWRAALKVNYQQWNLGLYDTPEEAARAYDAKARELFGDFARCNFPEDHAT